MTASVVSNRPATEAAFWRAERTTFVRSITPARTKSWHRPRIGPRLPMILFEAKTPCADRTDTGQIVAPRTLPRSEITLISNATGRAGNRSARRGRSLPTGKRQGLRVAANNSATSLRPSLLVARIR